MAGSLRLLLGCCQVPRLNTATLDPNRLQPTPNRPPTDPQPTPNRPPTDSQPPPNRPGARLNQPEVEEAALLSTVIHSGDHALLGRLLRAMANPACADYDGRTPLHVAARRCVLPC